MKDFVSVTLMHSPRGNLFTSTSIDRMRGGWHNRDGQIQSVESVITQSIFGLKTDETTFMTHAGD